MSDAQAESEQLVNAVLPQVERMLIEHGEFNPFGGAMTMDGDIAELEVGEEHQDASLEAVVETLKGELRGGAEANAFRATALVFPIQAQLPDADDETDAVAIALDHQANFSVVLIIPYALSEGAVEFGEAVAQQGGYEVFQGQH